MNHNPSSEVMRACVARVNCASARVVRAGTTILEVLFAIFVVIVGLLGIASIIPLAARNASESNAHNNVQSLGPRWLHSVATRGLNFPNSFEDQGQGYNWQWFKDYGPSNGFVQFRKSYLNTLEATPVGIATAAVPLLNSSSTNSMVTSASIARIWGYQPVCIDPVFFTEPDVLQRFNSGASRVGGYRAAVFPYFEDGFNPVTDPYGAPSDPWQDQPRMLRVTLGFEDSIPAAGASSQISRKLVDEFFSSPDDLSMTTYFQDPLTGEQLKDDNIPAARIFQSLTTGIQKSNASSEYSWLLTASPEEPRQVPTTDTALNQISNDYLISLVVMHRRDKQYVPVGPTPPPGSANDKPGGERLVWVYPLSGSFMDGTGGRVRLIANAATNDSVHIGDWIMLGKHFAINPGNLTQRYSYFRWYRIIAVDQESRVDLLGNVSPTGTDPYGNSGGQAVWSRDVVLDGPDFDMSPSILVGPGNAIATPTTGTLMSGVVSVLERRIKVE